MATVKPFKAWRPVPEQAADVACVPYDVINTREARELARGKSHSFLHVIRPEIDLPENISLYDNKVYEQGRKNLASLLQSDIYLQDEQEALFIYQLTMDGRTQTGIFGCVSVDEYNNDTILKHELTRPAKEDDRTRHIITQQAHAEPVMLTFRDSGNVTEIMTEIMNNNPPLYAFEAEDGVGHKVWKADVPDKLSDAFTHIPKLYIADGHHRCASAARTAEKQSDQNPNHNGNEEYNFFPAVLFPMNQMHIMAYNRIVYSIPDDFLDQLSKDYKIQKNAHPIPPQKQQISLYVNDNWYGLALKASDNTDPASKLDVALLQEQILGPVLNIEDQRTDPNIDFVGGIRGTAELEKLVDNGEAALGISMYPTSIQELMDVSDAGQLMPPKSTWFEPKLRSGLLIHTF